jgi:hypothetical protein
MVNIMCPEKDCPLDGQKTVGTEILGEGCIHCDKCNRSISLKEAWAYDSEGDERPYLSGEFLN